MAAYDHNNAILKFLDVRYLNSIITINLIIAQHYLSAPLGMSVNDGIDSELSSLLYSMIDQLAALVVSEGKGAFLIKADIQEAYKKWSQCMQRTNTC